MPRQEKRSSTVGGAQNYALLAEALKKEEEEKQDNFLKLDQPIRISAQSHDIAKELAAIAQDLGAINGLQAQDEQGERADEIIAKIIPDRKPQLQRRVYEEDEGLELAPEHGRRNSSKGRRRSRMGVPDHPNVIKEVRVKRLSTLTHEALQAQEADSDGSDGARKDDEAPGGESFAKEVERSDTSSSEGSVGSNVSSVDADKFETTRWLKNVTGLISRMQCKDEWDLFANLRNEFVWKETERAAELIHMEALIDMRDQELEVYNTRKHAIEQGVEELQMNVLHSLHNFSSKLSTATQGILKTRKERRKQARRFSFSNMKPVAIQRTQSRPSTEDLLASPKAMKPKTPPPAAESKKNPASLLLGHISDQQAKIAKLSGEVLLKEKAVEVRLSAVEHLRKQIAAEEAPEGQRPDVPEVAEEVKQLLKIVKDEILAAKKASEKENEQDEKENEKEMAPGLAFKQVTTVEALEADLKLLEEEVEALTLKVQDLTQRRKDHLDTKQKAMRAARRVAMMAAMQSKREGGDETKDDPMRPRGTSDADTGLVGNTSLEAAGTYDAGTVGMQLGELLAILETKAPQVRKQVKQLEQDRATFFGSVEKAREFNQQLSLETASDDEGQAEEGAAAESEPPEAQASVEAPAAGGENEKKVKHQKSARFEGASEGGGGKVDKTQKRRSSMAAGGRRQSVAGSKADRKPTATSPVQESASTAAAAAGVPVRKEVDKETTDVRPTKQGGGKVSKELSDMKKEWSKKSAELGKVLGGAAPGSLQAGASVLKSKKSALKQKEDQMKALEAELKQLMSATVPSSPQESGVDGSEQGGESSAASDAADDQKGVSSTSWRSPKEAETGRRKSVDAAAEEQSKGAEVQGSPELISKMLSLQGEGIQLTAQIKQFEDMSKMVRSQGRNMTADQKAAIKRVLMPEPIEDDLKRQLREGRRNLRKLQDEVKAKRAQWAGMDDYNTAMKNMKSDNSITLSKASAMMQKVKAATTMFARLIGKGDEPRRDSSGRRASKTGADIMTLQAAAMIARQKEEKKREEEEAQARLEAGVEDVPVKTPSQTFRRLSASLMNPTRRKSLELMLQQQPLGSPLAASPSPAEDGEQSSRRPSKEVAVEAIRIGGAAPAVLEQVDQSGLQRRKSMSVVEIKVPRGGPQARMSTLGIPGGGSPSPGSASASAVQGGVELHQQQLFVSVAGTEPDMKRLREQRKSVQIGAIARGPRRGSNDVPSIAQLQLQQAQQQQSPAVLQEQPRGSQPSGFVGLSGQRLSINPSKLEAAGFKSRASVAANANAQLAGSTESWLKRVDDWQTKVSSVEASPRKTVRFGDAGGQEEAAEGEDDVKAPDDVPEE